MYRYLDRPVPSLDDRERFLLGAMRSWVSAVRTGRCDCQQMQRAFQARGIPDAISDFGMLMATLNREGLDKLHFGSPCAAIVTSDEARLLALFDVADAGPLLRLKRVAATLVVDDAVARLAQAADYVAMALATTNSAGAE